ncbi:hypothetical protein LX99_02608 [Mucilaginibacter oryzae]|uniref:CDP-glycerol:poly(Glycerophosphate) glycerophosphotransferase n=1 Tax=Mucilaginibacter oryzae TaxID=468058 RepID=A0A316HBQ7_9SPHI|nr:hypothetical protein [Mucilaginibacter oryzae]PWK77723.1 hypothetical protein LX99_02608 [Mucilaginibacter oryzae]
MDSALFNEYSLLKSEYDLKYKGIDFNRILAHEFLLITFRSSEFEKLRYYQIISLFFKVRKLGKLRDVFSKNILVTNGIDRNDYTELIEGFTKDLSDYSYYSLTGLPNEYTVKLSLKSFFSAVNYVFFKKRRCINSFKEKLCIAGAIVYYRRILDDLENSFAGINLQGKKYVAFNSAYDIETLITLFFKSKGVTTYHLSHGVSYIKYKKTMPLDRVNGENITADNILVWGESSKRDLINNYSIFPEKILVAGNPKYPKRKINVKQSFKTGIVFLGRNIYDDQNVRIVEIVGEVSKLWQIKFVIKPHPRSDLNRIRLVAKNYDIDVVDTKYTINDILKTGSYDFAIAYNTTVYYEAMYYSLVCLRYDQDENEDYEGIEDKFRDEESLMKQINKFKNMENEDLNVKIDNLLVTVLGMGIDNYKMILNDE